jgi:hypothetical protein
MRIMNLAATDRAAGTNSRWSLLTIPPADGRIRDNSGADGGTIPITHVTTPPHTVPDDQDRLNFIQSQINAGDVRPSAGTDVGSFGELHGYRIPSNPPKSALKNVDEATFDFAGSSHLGFDQSESQNMCAIQTQLKARADYNRIKYAMAAVVDPLCNRSSRDQVLALMGASAPTGADDYFRSQGLQVQPSEVNAGPYQGTCRAGAEPQCPPSSPATQNYTSVCRLRCDGGYRYSWSDQTVCPAGWEALPGKCEGTNYRSTGGVASIQRGRPGEMFSAVGANTVSLQNVLDVQKQERHSSYLQTSLGQTLDAARVSGNQVTSVTESPPSNQAALSALRYILEPLDPPVRMQDWSMSFGSNPQVPSYTFADQFDIFRRNRMFNDIRQEYNSAPQPKPDNYCDWLTQRSAAGFPQPASLAATPPRGSAARETAQNIFAACGANGRTAPGSTVPPQVDAARQGAMEVAQAALRADGQGIISNTCMSCHDSSAMTNGNPFPARDPAGTYQARLRDFLSTTRGSPPMTWLESIVVATDPNSTGLAHMPPPDTSVANRPRNGGISDPQRRAGLVGWLTSVNLSADGSGNGFACEVISQNEMAGHDYVPPPASGSGGAAGAL